MRCESGNPQSPINITMPHHGKHQQKLVFHYQASQLHEMNNGHTIQVSHVSGCRVDLNDRKYKLRQCHFHAPSEHHIERKAFPMEMHLVHQDDTGHVLVIAVMMETDATQPVLSTLWKWLSEQTEHEVSIPLELSLSDILPTNASHYAYSGSLTTPPCTEGVQWIVPKDPMHVSQQDVDQFVHIIGQNARPIQPLRNRHVDED
jgi:carbonic anhydrase